MTEPKVIPEPRGFGEHTRKRSGENAHRQGWGLNEEERRKLPPGGQANGGGTDYDYGAQDFGDRPVDTSPARTLDQKQGSEKKAAEGNQRTSASRG